MGNGIVGFYSTEGSTPSSSTINIIQITNTRKIIIMGRHAFCAIERIQALNCLKETIGIEFTELQISKGLKAAGIPSNKVFISECIKRNLLTRGSSKEMLTFVSKSPIHYSMLEAIYTSYKNKLTRYQQGPTEKDKLSRAVAILKKSGYVILKKLDGDIYKLL